MFASVEEELEYYIQNEDKIFNDKEEEEVKEEAKEKWKCKKCHTDRIIIHKDNHLVCPQCGECISYNAFDMSLNGTEYTKKTYLYKRITHFISFLKNLQGSNYVSLTDEEKDKIVTMMGENRDVHSLKKVLKTLKLNKYYKYSYFILNRLFGVELLKLSPYIESKMRSLFEQIQYPFKKYNKKRRSNFISYKFVVAKFFLMLDKPDGLKYITLLKSEKKMHEHEKMWRKICYELGWQNTKINI